MAVLRQPYVAFALAAVLAVAVIIGAQTLADASAPPNSQASQSRVIGQAGFAYLGGLRVLMAGLIYQRLDPQFHQYGSSNIENRLDLIDSFRLIQALNPQLEQPYYYVAYMLMRRGDTTGALNLAREGIANNPTSGLLRANYVQLLMVQDKKGNLPEMLRQTKLALAPNITYSSADDEFESYGIFRTVFLLAGDQNTAKALQAAQAKLRAEGAVSPSTQSGQNGIFGLLNSWANSATSEEP
jgi:hypothetical protein